MAHCSFFFLKSEKESISTEGTEKGCLLKPLKKSIKEAAMAPQALRCEALLTPMATLIV
jgi:hypothetical protein